MNDVRDKIRLKIYNHKPFLYFYYSINDVSRRGCGCDAADNIST